MSSKVQHLELHSPIPTANAVIKAERTHRQYAAQLKRRCEDNLVLEIKSQRAQPIRAYPVHLIYTWHRPDRRTDKSNIAWGTKYIEDALQKAGVLRNDGWREIAGFEHLFVHNPNLKSPYVEVEIWEA